MRSILPRLRPERTTTLPGFSRSMRSRKSSPVWTSSRQLVGLSARRLKALTRPEVGEEVGPERRVDVHGRVDAGVHLLLDEAGVEVAGVEGDETHPGLGGRGAHREPEGREQPEG